MCVVAVLHPSRSSSSYTFIPVLPFDLIEVLDAPTPFIIGVHSDQKLQALSNVKCGKLEQDLHVVAD